MVYTILGVLCILSIIIVCILGYNNYKKEVFEYEKRLEFLKMINGFKKEEK